MGAYQTQRGEGTFLRSHSSECVFRTTGWEFSLVICKQKVTSVSGKGQSAFVKSSCAPGNCHISGRGRWAMSIILFMVAVNLGGGVFLGGPDSDRTGLWLLLLGRVNFSCLLREERQGGTPGSPSEDKDKGQAGPASRLPGPRLGPVLQLSFDCV